MGLYFYSKQSFHDVEDATLHFQQYDSYIKVVAGKSGRFEYYKKVCMLGKSFVSLSASPSGWGYETKVEQDGFLITFPHAGDFFWKTHAGAYKANAGAIAVADQREVSVSRYGAGTSYLTAYIDYSDMFKCLTMLLGHPPRARIYFDLPSAEAWKVRFIQSTLNSMLDYAENTKAPLKLVASSLKESLVGFLIYNFNNNYSRILLDTANVASPTPREIQIAAEFMAANNDPELTVGEVASIAGISVRSLQMGFKRYKRMSPLEFLRAERLLKSRTLLLSGEITSPQQAAFTVGFLNYHVYCKYYMQAFYEHPKTTYENRRTKPCVSLRRASNSER